MQRFIQLVLDGFDLRAEPKPQATPAPAASAAPAVATDAPLPVPPAEPRAPVAPAAPLAEVLVPARFSHPRATRRTVLQGTQVDYEFRRGRRRTIGFAVGAEGLVVSAPRWVALGDVEAALQEKAGWIVRKLGEQRERHARAEAGRIEWRDGATLPFMGEPVVLMLDPRQAARGGALLETHEEGSPGGPRLTLRLSLPQQAEPAQIRDATQAWLMRQARRVFIERLDHFAPLLGVQWHKLALSSANTRWGSASADGSIRLNWRLIHFRLPVIDYVVAHELSHLRVMDHSPRFWDTVRAVVPDYEALRGQLKDESIPLL